MWDRVVDGRGGRGVKRGGWNGKVEMWRGEVFSANGYGGVGTGAFSSGQTSVAPSVEMYVREGNARRK